MKKEKSKSIDENEKNKNVKENKKESKNGTSENTKWVIQSFFITFILSLIFAYISTNGVSNLSLIPAFLILLLVMFLGILFDIVGVAVTVANEEEFHAKATKKVKGSKDSIRLIKNAPKVANICADVIGDICGVLSGSISALIAIKISTQLNLPFNIQYMLSALVSALTVSGKAYGKGIANKHSTEIVHRVGIILNKFSKKK